MAKWAETEAAPDMPERILADPPEIFDGSDIWRTDPGGRATEYVRADLYRDATMQALASSGQAQDALAELAALRERADKLAVSFCKLDAQCRGMLIVLEHLGKISEADKEVLAKQFGFAAAALAEWEAGK